MNASWPPTPVGVLTPVKPGREIDLQRHLAAISAERSPFEALENTHLARLVILGQLKALPGIPTPTRRLAMSYLFFTAVSNLPEEAFFEELHERCAASVDGIWEHCVGYPETGNKRRFLRYMTHNVVSTQQTFAAFDATVAEVREALLLRRRHVAFALEAQQKTDAGLLEAFRERFAID